MRGKRTYNTVMIALLTAITVVCSWITIPFSAVPFTMQTFAVFIATLILGPLKGTLCVVLYILLGIAGLPVFSSFQGGLAAISGATGGFILGFVFIPLVGGYFCGKFKGKTVFSVTGLVLGQILCYSTGVLWYCYFCGNSASVGAVITVCVLPYVIPDFIKCILAIVVSKKVTAVIKGRIL